MARDEEEESVFEVYEKDEKIHIEMNDAFMEKLENSKGYQREKIYYDAVDEIRWEFKRYLEKYEDKEHVKKVRKYLSIVKHNNRYWEDEELDKIVDEGRAIIFCIIFTNQAEQIIAWLEETANDDNGVILQIQNLCCTYMD